MDDKRLLRQLKRDLKKAGNRKKRRYLKDLEAHPEDFDYGRKRSDVMNERPRPTARPQVDESATRSEQESQATDGAGRDVLHDRA